MDAWKVTWCFHRFTGNKRNDANAYFSYVPQSGSYIYNIDVALDTCIVYFITSDVVPPVTNTDDVGEIMVCAQLSTELLFRRMFWDVLVYCALTLEEFEMF